MAPQHGNLIEEYKAVLVGSPKRFRCELIELAETSAVVVYRLEQDVSIEGALMPQGTTSFGYFWQERNYNVYHFVSAAGGTLGFYINISDGTQIDQAQIYWRDLVVDIFITPDGNSRVLDEDEVPEDISPSLRALIDETRDYILDHLKPLTEEVERRSQALIKNGAQRSN